MSEDLPRGLTAARSALFGSAASLAIIFALSGCSTDNPAPNTVSAATPAQPAKATPAQPVATTPAQPVAPSPVASAPTTGTGAVATPHAS